MGFNILNPDKGKKPALASDNDDNINNNVCTHLIFGGLCPDCATTFISHPKQLLVSDSNNTSGSGSGSGSGSSSDNNKKKRKLLESQATTNNEGAKRKKKGCSSNNQEEEKRNLSWDCTTELKLYDDPWKIKKVLEKSDLGNMSRLLIGTEFAEKLIVPVVGGDNGIQVSIKDVDTNSMHSLLFRKWSSSKSYVFIEKWRKDFVVRRGLKEGDEIGLQWNPYNRHFNFSVLFRAAAAAN